MSYKPGDKIRVAYASWLQKECGVATVYDTLPNGKFVVFMEDHHGPFVIGMERILGTVEVEHND